jgi:hypothetical protein
MTTLKLGLLIKGLHVLSISSSYKGRHLHLHGQLPKGQLVKQPQMTLTAQSASLPSFRECCSSS